MMLRYGQSLFAQVAQTALCNRYHSIDQQLCRRLLLGLDRSESAELLITHAGMGSLLGVRREGVTAAAHKLQQAGVIRYSRGRIVVQDREELERMTCECYSVGRDERERFLPLSDGAFVARRRLPGIAGPVIGAQGLPRSLPMHRLNPPAVIAVID